MDSSPNSKKSIDKKSLLQLLDQLNSAEEDVVKLIEVFTSVSECLAMSPCYLADPSQQMNSLVQNYIQIKSSLHDKLISASEVLLVPPPSNLLGNNFSTETAASLEASLT
jgi:hypothetical protein